MEFVESMQRIIMIVILGNLSTFIIGLRILLWALVTYFVVFIAIHIFDLIKPVYIFDLIKGLRKNKYNYNYEYEADEYCYEEEC